MPRGQGLEHCQCKKKGQLLSLAKHYRLTIILVLALVLAVLQWRHYLLGERFVVRIDQKSLTYLWEQKITTPSSKMVSSPHGL